jgi:hypothetical protein
MLASTYLFFKTLAAKLAQILEKSVPNLGERVGVHAG